MSKIDKRNIEDIFALTPMQEGMLYHYVKNPSGQLYSEQLVLSITGNMDREKFIQTWEVLVQVHGMLRTVYRWEKMEEPVQILLKEHRAWIGFYDFSGDDAGDEESWFENIRRKDRETSFDLREVPFRVTLCTFAAGRQRMIISNHHILYDGWSNGIILKDFFNIYTGLASEEGKDVALLERQQRQRPAGKFKEFVKWLRAQEKEIETGKLQETFWKERFYGFEIPPALSSLVPVSREKEEKGKRVEKEIDGTFEIVLGEAEGKKLRDFVVSQRITLAALFYGAWGLVLQRYIGSNDVVFGTTVSGRPAQLKGVEEIVGLFINTLPLRLECNPGQDIPAFLGKIHDTLQDRKDVEFTAPVKIKEWVSPGGGELFDTLLVIENYPLDESARGSQGSLHVESFATYEMTNYDLTVGIMLAGGGDIHIKFMYQRYLFDDDGIKRLAAHFTNILTGLLVSPTTGTGDIEMLTVEEKRQLVEEFNRSYHDYPQGKTIYQLFEEQARRTPGHVALLGNRQGLPGEASVSDKGYEETLTYAQFLLEVEGLAGDLVGRGVHPGDIVAIKIERCIEMVAGIFAILKAGGAYLPIDPAYPQDRIDYILEDSRARLLITGDEKGDRQELLSPIEQYKLYKTPRSGARSGAYVIYTSGSTGHPKGVVVEQRSVVNLLYAMQDLYPLGARDTYLFKTSFVFDVSVTELFGWFMDGGRLAILERGGEREPRQIIERIETSCVTHINFTPSMFAAFLEVLDNQSLQRVRSLKYIFAAGEALSPDLVEAFAKLNTSISLENIYGPTEATVYASYFAVSQWSPSLSKTVPIGKPMPNTQLTIISKTGEAQPLGVPGELCIGGVGLARGYLNKPELTAANFLKKVGQKLLFSGHVPATSLLATSHQITLYKSGDLCRWLADGNIEFLGRIDHQVKIRGFRIELGEIESHLLQHPGVKESVVTVHVESTGETALCAYVVLGDGAGAVEAQDLREHLSQSLPSYMVPGYFVFLEAFPLAASGKIDRKSLPLPGVSATKKEYIAPRGDIEKKLAVIWNDILSLSNPPGIDDHFFESGGHSLKAARLSARVQKVFDIEITIGKIFELPTIRQMAEFIERAIHQSGSESSKILYREIPLVEKKEYYPLSSSQERMYLVQQMNPSSTVYNIAGMFLLEGEWDTGKLEQAFKKLIQRHDSLRTSFHLIAGQPVQKIHEPEDIEFTIRVQDVLSSVSLQEKLLLSSFTLSSAPLLRVILLREAEEQHLLVDMHHIIADGVSLQVMVKDFIALYRGQDLPEIGIRYRDYAEWWRIRKQGETMQRQEAYWLTEFAGELPLIDLPSDYPRSSLADFSAAHIAFEIEKEEIERLRMLALTHGASLFMVLSSFFTILLTKLSGQEEIITGTPVSGRNHAEIERVIGVFINTLAMRNFPNGDKTYVEFLQETKTRALAAFENQDYPFEELVEKLEISRERDTSRHPLFDVLFNMQDAIMEKMEFPGLTLTPCDLGNPTTKFDLTLRVFESGERVSFSFEYVSALFKESTIQRFIDYFKHIVSFTLEHPGCRLAEIDMLPETEKERLLFELNDTTVAYPRKKTLHGIFQEQAQQKPANAALVFNDSILTYAALDEASTAQMGLLIEEGVQPGQPVALMMERSLEMIIGILAIMKAGGVYLPIDPAYPQDRIDYILSDSGARLLLRRSEKGDRQELLSPIEKCKLYKTPRSGAYVIYTSGSTGRPKGVLVEHAAAVNYISYQRAFFNMNDRDRVLQFTSIGFDPSIEQVFLPLFCAAQLVLADRETLLDIKQLSYYLASRNITHFHAVPSFLEQVEIDSTSIYATCGLKRVISGGDICSLAVARKWSPIAEFYNKYGPTETTITSIETKITPADEQLPRLPIGRPVANTQVYLLDRWMQLVPTGAAGEIYIGGDGVAPGYLNNPELTNIKFASGFIGCRPVPAPLGANFLQKVGQKLQLSGFAASTRRGLYRTGDVGRWLEDGRLDFLGRVDNQVKVRGFRIEIGEIENLLRQHEYIKDAVVIDLEGSSGEKYLCAYVVLKRAGLLQEELRDYLGRSLPAYMIPSYFVELDDIPLTANGKIDRKALRQPVNALAREYTAPRDEVELALVGVWSAVLGIEKEKIGIDDSFFELGGHSLKAMQLVARIHQTLGQEISIGDIFQADTIRLLAQRLSKSEKHCFQVIEPVEKKEYYDVSPSQKRMILLQQFDPKSTAYNIPAVFEIIGNVDWERLEGSFRQLIERHESLRTSFHFIDGQPVQRVHRPGEVSFELELPSNCEGRKKQAESYFDFVRPFDLSRVPLFRAGCLYDPQAEAEQLLFVDMHHIISDGLSVTLFIKELLRIFDSEELEPLAIQYKDFTVWQYQYRQSESLQRSAQYWLDEFAGEIPVLDLPGDFARPSGHGFPGKIQRFILDSSDTDCLMAMGLGTGATLYMVLLSLFNIFLARLSGQEEIIIGSPVSGRTHIDTRNLIGIFINTLAIRSFPVGEKRFGEYLNEIKKITLAAFENQDYPFEELVEEIKIQRDVSRNPLFDVMFSLQETDNRRIRVPGLELLPIDEVQRTVKFDLNLRVVQSGEALTCYLEYPSALFKDATIQRFIEYFRNIVSSVIARPNCCLADIEMLPQAEKERLLSAFNDTATVYPEGQLLHRLFEEQAGAHPHRVALTAPCQGLTGTGGEFVSHLTFGELNCSAEAVVGIVGEFPSGPGKIIGIRVEPSVEMIVGILGILKSGAAYLPIDPQQPLQRMEYILADSAAVLCLSTRAISQPAHLTLPVKYIDSALKERKVPAAAATCCSPDDAVYCIYTSGTTGKSKGVLLRHRNLVNYVTWFQERAGLTCRDRSLLTSSYSFDLGYTAIYPPLIAGAHLHLVFSETYHSPMDLLETIARYQVSYLKLTPSLFSTFVESPGFAYLAGRSVRLVLLGGEAIKCGDIEKAHAVASHIRFMNHYGPTEATIGCIARFIDFENFASFRERPVIGTPIANMKAFILDKYLHLVPGGVAGELCVSGAGVAAGYLNRPELTAGKFVYGARFSLAARPQSTSLSFHRLGTTLYRTGDLCRWLAEGDIEFLGRIDHQVKIRGFRIELGEIESCLLTHEKVKETVVTLHPDANGENYICAYMVFQDGPTGKMQEAEMRSFLGQKIPAYMIPSYFIELEEIPLTANGKIDRKRLPIPVLADQQRSYTAPRNEIEKKLVRIWAYILKIDEGRIGIDDNFFTLGGHSLKAMQMTSFIYREIDKKISLGEIFQAGTIRELALLLSKQDEERYIAIEPVEKRDYYALSSSQKRMYLIQQFDLESTAYHIPALFKIVGNLDRQRLQESFRQAIERHESLRTSFHLVEGQPVQRVHDVEDIEFAIEYRENPVPGTATITGEDGDWEGGRRVPLMSSGRVPVFDLGKTPLLRLTIEETGVHSYYLLIEMHHIISDGLSNSIFIEDLMAFYHQQEIEPLRLQYKDFSAWHNRRRDSEIFKGQEDYWIEELAGEIPLLALPTDRSRPLTQDHRGDITWFELDEEETGKIIKLGVENDATIFMVILSLFNILLAKLSGQEDIIIGSPVSGRVHPDIEKVMGIFINTLALRNYPAGDKSYSEFLAELRNRVLGAFENQEYPFEDLVEKVGSHRDVSRNPLFDVLFVFQNMEKPVIELPGMLIERLKYEAVEAKFDMTLNGSEENGKIIFRLQYAVELFKKETIDRFVRYFQRLIAIVLDDPGVSIRDMDILPEEEKRQILVEFNDSAIDYPQGQTVYQIFERQAAQLPAQIAVVAPLAKGKATCQLTYGFFNQQADEMAAYLRGLGVLPGAIVALELYRSLHMVISIFAILKAGGAYLPIDPAYPQDRIDYILKDSQARGACTLLGDTTCLQFTDLRGPLEDEKKDRQKLFTSTRRGEPCVRPISKTEASRKDEPGVDGHSSEHNLHHHNSSFLVHNSPTPLAYIIYTSGSTGRPKGVMVEHAALVNLLMAMQDRYPLGAKDTYLFKTSFQFDVSVSELFGWFWQGGRLVILEKDGEKDPVSILESIQRYMVTHINFVPSMFQVFLDILEREYLANLFSLRYIFLAGEALPHLLVERFRALGFGDTVALENIYGPTEATVYSSWYSLAQRTGEHAASPVPIGKPLPNVHLHILDKWHHLQPLGIPGELFIAGAGLARGYLNNPELTAANFLLIPPKSLLEKQTFRFGMSEELFDPKVADAVRFLKKVGQKLLFSGHVPATSRLATSHQITLYKSGDLCRWLPDGNIEFLGRMDFQVKIRGFRIEIGEIESRLLEHECIKTAIVVVRADKRGENYLCAYVVTGKGKKEQDENAAALNQQRLFDELKDFLSQSLPLYMIPSFFVDLDEIPLNSSGKIDRKALPGPGPGSRGGREYKAPRNELENKMAGIWAEILDLEKETVSIDDDFFNLGGHSLKATVMVARIHKEFRVKLPLAEIFKAPRIRDLCRIIKDSGEAHYEDIQPVEKKEYYPLSSAQERLFFLQQLSVAGTAYNIPFFCHLIGRLDVDKLEAVFNKLIARHDSLRTSFDMLDGQPVQRVHEPGEISFKMDYYENTGAPGSPAYQRLLSSFIVPFSLSHAPLLRVRLLREAGEKYFLMVDMHHMISDGTSMGVLMREFKALYAGQELASLPLQYKDYALWQAAGQQVQALEKQELYWLEQLAGDIPVLDLPTDYPRPEMQDFQAGTVSFDLSYETGSVLRELALTTGTTNFMVMLALFNVLLSKLSGQEDMIVGTPVAGRRHVDLQNIIGMFVGTLALRNFPVAGKGFKQFLLELKNLTLAAFENQEYPFEHLVEKIQDHRDISRNPLFDVFFSFPNMDEQAVGGTNSLDIPGVEVVPFKKSNMAAKFDLELICLDGGEAFHFSFQYAAALFKRSTIQRFAAYFKAIASQVAVNPARKIGQLEILPLAEKERLVYDFNNTAAGYPKDKTLPGIFEEQAQQKPNRTALVFKESVLSYAALDEAASSQAAILIEKGLQLGEPVALMMEKSLEMVIGILAIMKAGGVYLPIEPTYPQDRIDYILADSGARGVTSYLKEHNLHRHHSSFITLSSRRPPAYIIYTSGSTGRPKGVMVEHRSAVNFIHHQCIFFGIDARDRVLQFTSIGFDPSLEQIFMPLFRGAALVLIDRETLLDMSLFSHYLASRNITHFHAVPSFLEQVEMDPKGHGLYLEQGLKRVVSGGDVCPQRVAEKWSLSVDFYNKYGPTETTITSIETKYLPADAALPRLPIGKPVANTQVYVLDRNLNVVPIGTPGEIYIGGDGVTPGYLNNPELTSEKFARCRGLYRSGDVGRWLEDGRIDFLGRIDHQVKIRGFRIEVGEIENLLRQHEEVKDAIIVDFAGNLGEKSLCAYVVLKRAGLLQEKLEAEGANLVFAQELRDYLSRKLPAYMIPSYFVELEEIPLTANGKIDRKALPFPHFGVGAGKEYVAPRNDIENRLVDIWSRILHLEKEKISIDDSFFELGGHSLRASAMMNAIHKEMAYKVDLTDIFKNPTVRGVGSLVKAIRWIKDKNTGSKTLEKSTATEEVVI